MSRSNRARFPEAVLVVDDEPSIAQLIAAALAPRVGEVQTAASGEAAAKFIGERSFGCVVADKNLGGALSGLDVLRLVRERAPHAACILMTGYSSTSSAIEALRLGATDYLEKPFDLDLLAEKVQRALADARTRHERSELAAALEGFEAELEQKRAEISRQRTRIETFDAIVEQRVRQATADLQARCRMLSEQLASTRGADAAEQIGLEMILETVRDIQLSEGREVASARGKLARVVRQLEQHLALLRAGRARKAQR